MNPTFWIDGRHAIAAKGCRGAAIGARPSESSKKQPQHEDDRPLDTPPTSRQDHRSSAADAADVLVRHQQGVLPALAVFDVCEAARYAARCIRGAEQLTDGDFGAIAKRLPRTTPVLIYCYRGNASRTWAAMVAGHRVPLSRGQYSVDGGYEAFAAPLAAGHLALSAQWRDNEEALDLVHSDAPRRAAFVFTYGQAPGRYGVDLAFPEFAHIAAAGVPLVQEDLGLDQLLAVRACASIRRNRRRTHRGSRGRAGRVPRGGRTASVRSADPGCPRLTLSNDVAILRNGTPDVPSMPATSSSQDTPQVMTPTRPRVLAAVLVLALAGLSAGPARADAAAAGRYYEDGLARFARDDIAGAIIQLRNALQQDQAMLAAQLLLARALLRNGELGPAEVAFEEALRRGVSRAEVAVPLAGIDLAQGRPERLIERVPAGELPPALRVDVLSLRGTAYAQLGKHDEARASFDEARRLDPRSPVPLVAEIPVLLAAGEPVTARERARRAVELAPGSAAAWNARASVAQAAGELDAALADYARALDLQPDHLDARIARAAVLADLGRDGEAQVELDRLGPQAAGEPRGAYLRALLAGRRGDGPALADNLAAAARAIDALPPEWLAGQEQILMIGALVHHAQRQPQKARAHLETLIRRHPRNLGAPKLLARIELDANEPARTIALLGPVLRARPEDAQALYLMGSAYLAQKRYLQATDFLERAAARGGDPRTQASLALGQIGLGQGERGMENLAQAFARAPGDIGLGSYLVSFHLGRGDSGSAAEVAEALAAARPEHVVALNLLGVARAARGDSAGAREAYRAALARDGGFTPARLNLVRLDAAQGRHAEARAALEAILAKNRDHAAAMYEMGQLERLAGRPTEALRWLEKAYAAAPRDIQTARALVQALLEGGDRAAALDRAQALAARRVGDAGALESLGRAQLAFGNPQGAHQSFREMSRLAGVDAQAQVHVGYLQLGAGNPQGPTPPTRSSRASPTSRARSSSRPKPRSPWAPRTRPKSTCAGCGRAIRSGWRACAWRATWRSPGASSTPRPMLSAARRSKPRRAPSRCAMRRRTSNRHASIARPRCCAAGSRAMRTTSPRAGRWPKSWRAPATGKARAPNTRPWPPARPRMRGCSTISPTCCSSSETPRRSPQPNGRTPSPRGNRRCSTPSPGYWPARVAPRRPCATCEKPACARRTARKSAITSPACWRTVAARRRPAPRCGRCSASAARAPCPPKRAPWRASSGPESAAAKCRKTLQFSQPESCHLRNTLMQLRL